MSQAKRYRSLLGGDVLPGSWYMLEEKRKAIREDEIGKRAECQTKMLGLGFADL